MKYVWTQYEPGDCGTFFAWFVNQHHGFVQNRIPFKINDPVGNEVIADWCMWEWQYNLKNSQDDAHSIDKFWKQMQQDATAPINHLRICFKSFEEHNLKQIVDQNSTGNVEAVVQMIDAMHQQAGFGCLMLETDQSDSLQFIQRMQLSFETFDDDQTAESMYLHRYQPDPDQHNRTEYERAWDVSTKLLDVPHCRINIGDLLFRNSESEYLKLVEFLDVEPNPNWKLLINFYRYQVFENIAHVD